MSAPRDPFGVRSFVLTYAIALPLIVASVALAIVAKNHHWCPDWVADYGTGPFTVLVLVVVGLLVVRRTGGQR